MAVKSKLYSMTPKEIVAELDKYIIGQEDAKNCSHRAEEPLSEKSAFRRNARRNHPEEYPHDGTYRLW